MFKCLQTHYKMQAVVCLNISVSAFCAAQKHYLTLFKIPKATVLFQHLGRLDLNKQKTIGLCVSPLGFHQCFATSALSQHWSIHQNCYWARIDADKRLN